MTTGHWDPGYGDVVSRLRRARSALPADSCTGARTLQHAMQVNMETATLDEIKQRAKDMWLQPDRAATSYNDHFKERLLDVSEITTTRPTSAGRKNKPHPSNVFLTTRLHNVPGYGRLQDIPGYHNPDTTIGKEAYRVDGSVPTFEQQYRSEMKATYVGRPNTPAVNQYKTIKELEVIEDPIERQGYEAYLKVASKQDQAKILNQLREYKDRERYRSFDADKFCRPKTVPALNRYLREAGALEADHLQHMYNRANGLDSSRMRRDVGTLRKQDLEAMRRTTYTHPTKRGDYLIHPEWPPKFAHHRLNGLSSVDIPYYPGRR